MSAVVLEWGVYAAQVLVAPRMEDRYASHGVVASIEKVGRFPGGEPAAERRGMPGANARPRAAMPPRGAHPQPVHDRPTKSNR